MFQVLIELVILKVCKKCAWVGIKEITLLRIYADGLPDVIFIHWSISFSTTEFAKFSNSLLLKSYDFVLHSEGTYAQTLLSLRFLTHQTPYYHLINFSSLNSVISPSLSLPEHCQLIRLEEFLQNTGNGMEHIGEEIF
jgi:hypothetical protein